MIKKIKLNTPKDIQEFMDLALACPAEVGVHTVYNQIADAKSPMGMLSLDYSQPVNVVTEYQPFLRKLNKWAQ